MNEPNFFTFKNDCKPVKLVGANKNIFLKKIVSTNGRIQDLELTVNCFRKSDSASSSFPKRVSSFRNFSQPANDKTAILDEPFKYTDWDEVEIVPSLATNEYKEFEFLITYINQ